MSLQDIADVWEYSNARCTAFIVLLSIADQAGIKSIAFCEYEFVARRCRISVTELAIHLRELEKMGEIKIETAGHNDSMFAAYLQLRSKIDETDIPRPSRNTKPMRDGFVYVLRSDNGNYKIGRTRDYKNRLATFSVKLPFVVSYDLVIQDGDCVDLERRLHRRFVNQKINGEWFALTSGDLEYLRAEYADQLVEVD